MNPARQSIHSVLGAVAAVTLALGLVTGLVAQESEKPMPGPGREEAKQDRAKLPFSKGTLDSIDLFRHQLKLKIDDNLRTFTYTANTYIFRGKEKITPDALKPGETIALRVYTDKEGTVLVQRIKAYGTNQTVGADSPGPAESGK
jgi:hypothetical protein